LVSLRKRYQDRAEDSPPISTPPSGHREEPYPTQVGAAETPPAMDVPKQPADQPAAEPSPAEAASRSAIKQRLAELERAQEFQREGEAIQQPQADEPQSSAPQMPARVQAWCDAHPEYFADPLAQAELNVALLRCAKGGMTWDDANFVETVERHLGLRQQHQSQANGNQPRPAATAPRTEPVQRQQYAGPPHSSWD
jgi:hypothetical protein